MRFCLLTTSILLASLGQLRADAPVVTAVVTGGAHDLTGVIVAIPMASVNVDPRRDFGAGRPGQDQMWSTQYLRAGRLGPSNEKPELLFAVGELKAGQRLIVEVRPMPATEPPSLPWLRWRKVGSGATELLASSGREQSQRIARFTHFTFDRTATSKEKVLTNPTIKPFHHVYDASGKALLTNGPDGKYPHHRGIFYGFNRITYDGKKADVWHCQSGESQRAGKETATGGNLFGLHWLNVGWHGTDGARFALEERELAFYPMSGGLLVEFRSKLTTDIAGGVKLDGDPQHAGFHFRANSAVEAVDKQTYFLRPDGKGKEGEERNWDPKTRKGPVNLPWNAMSFVLDGKRRTVVYLDHPDNPKESRQSERTYGRIGTYFEYTLTPQKPLFVRYRLWIQDGEMTVAQCESLSRAFVEPIKVEVK